MVSGPVSPGNAGAETGGHRDLREPDVLFLRPAPFNIDSMTLPNLIFGATLYPEWAIAFGVKRKSREIIEMVDFWLRDRIALEAKKRTSRVSPTHSSKRAQQPAADYMLKTPGAGRVGEASPGGVMDR
jgi:hypothetical protein